MAKNDTRVTDNPKLKQKELSDGNFALYLDYYLGRVNVVDKETGEVKSKVQRKREFLHLTLLASPRTPIERKQNKDTLELARKIRNEKEQELLQQGRGYRLNNKQDINFFDYYQAYIDRYTKSDIRMLGNVLKQFREFLRDTPEYSKYEQSIKPTQITKDMMIDFTEYLQSIHKGEGGDSYYKRFKKVINYAVEHDIILKDPCRGVTIKVDNSLTKPVLSMEEIEQLIKTHNSQANHNIRRAFIFCLYTGMRFCDVKVLTYSSIDYSNKKLRFEQSKTKGHSANSVVVLDIDEWLLDLIGEPQNPNNKDERIFALPSYEMCLKSLKRWVKSAGIDKNITWHCSRHSLGTNLLKAKTDIRVISAILGHSGLKHTQRYTRVEDELKREAMGCLPRFDVSHLKK